MLLVPHRACVYHIKFNPMKIMLWVGVIILHARKNLLKSYSFNVFIFGLCHFKVNNTSKKVL